jgi:hypothetical protein
MAEYLGPATTNAPEIIRNTDGRRVPDRYATGDSIDKLQGDHDRIVDPDISCYSRETPEGWNGCK